MYIYVCICKCVYVCVYVYIYICIYIYMYMYLYMYMMCMCVSIYKCIHMFVYIYTYNRYGQCYLTTIYWIDIQRWWDYGEIDPHTPSRCHHARGSCGVPLPHGVVAWVWAGWDHV